MAFTEDRGAEFQVFVWSADGSGDLLVASIPNNGGGGPVWSPDGSQIGLGAENASLTPGVSLVIEADGSEVRSLDDFTYESWRGGDMAARIH
jgi:Tol biopolymer transport system component